MSGAVSCGSLLGRLREQGVELVTVIGPRDKDGPCLDWVGAVLSVTGNTPGVPTLEEAVRDGLFHPGCRHTLAAFNPDTVSPQRLDDAETCTRHAVAAMQARARGAEPPFLAARQHLREEAQRHAPAESGAVITARAKFERVYESARKADAAGDRATALTKTRAARDILREHDLFGPNQPRLAATLDAYIRRLQD